MTKTNNDQVSLLAGISTEDVTTTTPPPPKLTSDEKRKIAVKAVASVAGGVAAVLAADAARDAARSKKTAKPAAAVASEATAEVLSVALSAIIADKKFNSRDGSVEDPDGNKIIESIRVDGLLEPLVVTIHKRDAEGNPAKFFLISGFRRFAALSRLVAEEKGSEKYGRVLCRVIEVKDEIDQKIKNLVENIQRSDLAPHELAARTHEISASGLSNGDIAKRLGLSRPHVANLVRCKANLHPTLWAALRNVREGARDGTGVTLTWFIQMAALNHEDQLARWEEKLGKTAEAAEGEGDGSGEEEAKKERSKAPSKKIVEEYMFALKTVAKAERDDEWKTTMDTLKWVRGERRTPPIKIDVVADGDE
jgi:ParB/RepB/Spo0J family partition protein